ncbi:MAG: anti-sigma factor family protein [Brevefilum sp.]
MSDKRRSNRELNKLSAYLDNALPARQARKLEARLAVDPELREKLDDLRRTKLLLSRLTRVRAPHNFTLTPDMVPERIPRRQTMQTTLRLASALAAILLVVTFGAEFIFGEIRQPQEMAADAPVMMEAARAPEDATPAPLIQWGPPGDQPVGMGGDASNMEESTGEPMLEMEPVPEEEAAPEEEPEIIQEDPEEAEPPAAKGGDLILGVNTNEGGEIIERSEPAVVQQEPQPLPWPDILHWAQIALAVITVGGGLALLILRQRRRA